MSYKIPHPPVFDRLKRRDRILSRAPQATSAIEQLDKASKSPKFGRPIREMIENYHFPSHHFAESFFRNFLKRKHNREPSDHLLRYYTTNSINTYVSGDYTDPHHNDKIFARIASSFIKMINDNEQHSMPTPQFGIGPTGSGKTIFSRSLVTICLNMFWSNRIVPSRIEWSKYDSRYNNTRSADVGSKNTYKIDADSVRQFLTACLARDFLIYVCLAPNKTQFDITKIASHVYNFSPLSGMSRATPFLDLIRAFNDHVYDGDTCVLGKETRERIIYFVSTLTFEEQTRLIHHASRSMGIRFLISFDGFDCMKVEDFLFDRENSRPIRFIIELLKQICERPSPGLLFSEQISAHYVIYMRDTSFDVLRMEILDGAVGEQSYPCFMIVPPSYQSLVQHTAFAMTGIYDPIANSSEQFVSDLFDAFDRNVFRQTDLVARKEFNFIFSSNARRMKQHLLQTILSIIYHAGLMDASLFRRTSGINTAIVWQNIIQHHLAHNIQRYVLLEDLFLHETQQLMPKYLVEDSSALTSFLALKNLRSAIRCLKDRKESDGLFGCVFNYFVRAQLKHDDAREDITLIMIRIMQFVRFNDRPTLDDVSGFITKIGYDVNHETVMFFVLILIRTEFVKWNSSETSRSLSDVGLYVTTRTIMLLDRLMCSISFLSENMITSLHSIEDIRSAFVGRSDEIHSWIADAIYNSSLGLLKIKRIEKIERSAAKRYKINLDRYLFYNELRDRLKAEADLILANNRNYDTVPENILKIRDRWECNRQAAIKRGLFAEGFVMLGGSHERDS